MTGSRDGTVRTFDLQSWYQAVAASTAASASEAEPSVLEPVRTFATGLSVCPSLSVLVYQSSSSRLRSLQRHFILTLLLRRL